MSVGYAFLLDGGNCRRDVGLIMSHRNRQSRNLERRVCSCGYCLSSALAAHQPMTGGPADTTPREPVHRVAAELRDRNQETARGSVVRTVMQ